MLADRICVMKRGRILQTGTPTDIYYRPADAFVAGFIGETNLIAIDLHREGDGARFAHPALACPDPTVTAAQISPAQSGDTALLMIRPELIGMSTDAPAEAPGACVMEGRVEEYFIKGSSIQYRVRVDGVADPVIVDVLGTAVPPAEVDRQVWLRFARADAYILGKG